MDVEMQSGYMLLFRGTEWDKDLSPDQIQDTMTRWTDWFDGLMADGRAKSGQPLERDERTATSSLMGPSPNPRRP